MTSKTMPTAVRIPLAWTIRRRYQRIAVLGCLITPALALLTLPMLWLDAVWWLISVGAALTALPFVIRSIILRAEAADIASNGPFIDINSQGILLPERLAAPGRPTHRVDLSTFTFDSWRTKSQYCTVSKTRDPAESFLLIEGDELNLLLVANNGSGANDHLQEMPRIESAKRESTLRDKGLRRIIIDQARLVEAEAFLRTTREARNADRLIRMTDALQRQAKEKAARQAAWDPVMTAQIEEMNRSSAERIARSDALKAKALAATQAPLDADNIRTRLFVGTLKEVPPEFIEHVRNWRDFAGATLLHQLNSNRAVNALLAAGVDPAARDNHGKTALMLYGRNVYANQSLMDAGTPLHAVCNRGHNAVHYQCSPAGIGYVEPDFKAVEALIAAGLPPPTRAEAAAWKDAAAHCVTAAAEQNACIKFCAWLDNISIAP